MLRIACLLVALLLSAVLPTYATAQGRVSVEVDAGYEGLYSGDFPTPVRVRLSNPGPSFRARVELGAASEMGRILYYTEVDLPQNSSKQLTMYPEFGSFAASMRVRVFNGKAEVADARDDLRLLGREDVLYGVLAPDTGPYAALASRGAESETAVARLTPQTLPERADALLALRAIVVDGADTRGLSAKQKEALRAWVQLGGALTIAGGPNAQANIGGLSDLAPVAVGGQQNASDLNALAKLAGGVAPPAGGVTTQATRTEGARVDAAATTGPLVVHKDLGRGRVTWLAYSPSASPFREWRGSIPLLRGVSESTTQTVTPNVVAGWTVDSFLRNIAAAQLPPTIFVAAFLLLYTLVIGPVLYLVLKRKDRRELAWVLVPAITLLFSGLAYGANFLVRGAGTTLRSLEIVDVYPGATAHYVTTYGGLFSPGRRAYDVALAPGMVARGPDPDGMDMMMDPTGNPLGGGPRFNVEVGERSVLRDIQLDVYSMRTFSAQHVETGSSQLLEATITGNGTSYEGQVRNLTSAPFESVYFVDQDGMRSVGPVGAGQTGPIRSDAPRIDPGWGESAPPADWDRRQVVQSVYDQMVHGGGDPTAAVLGSNEVLVMAWQKTSAQPFTVLNGRAESLADRLMILHSTYELRPGAVQLELTPVPQDIASAPNQTTLSYRLPEGVSVESLRVIGRSPDGAEMMPMPPVMEGGEEGFTIAEPGPVGPGGVLQSVSKVEIQKAGADEWTPVTVDTTTQEQTEEVLNASQYIGADGMVTVRLTGEIMGDPAWVKLEVRGRKE